MAGWIVTWKELKDKNKVVCEPKLQAWLAKSIAKWRTWWILGSVTNEELWGALEKERGNVLPLFCMIWSYEQCSSNEKAPRSQGLKIVSKLWQQSLCHISRVRKFRKTRKIKI